MESPSWNSTCDIDHLHISKKNTLGTIHLRCRQIFTFFDPYPLRRQSFTTIRWQICPIFDPSLLKNADVLNGWSLINHIQHQIEFCHNKGCISVLSQILMTVPRRCAIAAAASSCHPPPVLGRMTADRYFPFIFKVLY